MDYTPVMDRRRFLRALGVAASTVPVAAVGAVSAVARPVRQPLPRAHRFMILTEERWNELVDRINDLSARAD
jgi:hypothetical protein